MTLGTACPLEFSLGFAGAVEFDGACDFIYESYVILYMIVPVILCFDFVFLT